MARNSNSLTRWFAGLCPAVLLSSGLLLQSLSDPSYLGAAGGGGPLGTSTDQSGSFLGPDVHKATTTDLCLSMSWEPTIAVDPNNPMTIAVAQGSTIQVSQDAFSGHPGTTQTLTVPIFANWCTGGDPSLAFDSQGRFFITYLATPLVNATSCANNSPISQTGREVLIAGYELVGGQFAMISGPGVSWPVAVTAQAGFPAPANNADKEWLAADASAASPNVDSLYVTWVDLTNSEWEVYSTFSTDQGQTWSGAFQISSTDDDSGGDGDGLPDDGVRPWPPHVAVAPNGDVYVAYHAQLGFLDTGNRGPDGTSGEIVLRRSTNGGSIFGAPSLPYPPGQADMTWNVQSLANGVIPGARFWLQGSSQPWILPDPHVDGVVHVVANDDPDNNVDAGDAADVFIVTSNDGGQNWGAPAQVDSGPAGTFQVMPTAAIDPVTGAIVVTYYDNRQGLTNAAGNFLLDLIATHSTDGGQNWFPESPVNDNPFDPDLTASTRFCTGTNPCPGCDPTTTTCPATTRIGEYNGNAYGECTAYMVWADNNTCGSGGSNLDTFLDFDPERGGDLEEPQLDCPANTAVGCTESTDPSNTGSAEAFDTCDFDPAVNSFDQVMAGNCPEGNVLNTIERTWTTTDAAGNFNSCQQVISVTDFNGPLITVPPDLALECNEPGGVSGDDPQVQNWLDQATAFDDCTEAELSNNAPDFFPSGCGDGQATDVIFTAIDECGNSSFDNSSVWVVDSTAPEVTCSVNIDSLWSPNHNFVDVGFSFDASDVCDPGITVSISVSSDEDPSLAPGAGGSIFCPDAIVGEDNSVLLRAERSGSGDGRVYVLTVTATDSCGNASSCSTTVSVPSNQSPQGVAVDSGQTFDPTVCPIEASAGIEDETAGG